MFLYVQSFTKREHNFCQILKGYKMELNIGVCDGRKSIVRIVFVSTKWIDYCFRSLCAKTLKLKTVLYSMIFRECLWRL